MTDLHETETQGRFDLGLFVLNMVKSSVCSELALKGSSTISITIYFTLQLTIL